MVFAGMYLGRTYSAVKTAFLGTNRCARTPHIASAKVPLRRGTAVAQSSRINRERVVLNSGFPRERNSGASIACPKGFPEIRRSW